MRVKNVYGNWHSPSKDIGNNFTVLEYLQFICVGGMQTSQLCSFISFESDVMNYLAVMTQCRVMADRGDFVKVTAAEVDLLFFSCTLPMYYTRCLLEFC